MSKTFDLFFNFDGNCKEALAFYAKVFDSTPQDVMTYGQTPESEGYDVPAVDKDRIMYANLPIFGCNVMFSDCPSGSEYTVGTNVCPTLGTTDKDEVRRLYAALAEGGQGVMEPQQTFWSELFSMVVDKYGIIWQLCYNKE